MQQVYFVKCGEHIKIGVATNIKSRISNLSVGSASPITLIASVKGDVHLERKLHERLERHRTSGEWFKDCLAVRSVIREVVETNDVAPLPQKRIVPPPNWVWFARHCWPDKTAAHLATLAGKDERTAKRWLSGEFEPPNSVVAALIAKLFERG